MNVQDMKKENHTNIWHPDFKFNLELNYLTECKIIGKGWDENLECFTIEARCLTTNDLIDSYYYGSKREYESDLKTIKLK